MTEGILPIIRYIPNMMTTKKAWTSRQDMSLIIGSISTLNTTFFTR